MPNNPNGISELRTPAFTQLDLSMATNLLPGSTNQSLSMGLDVFNALDQRSPTGFIATDLPTFGQITAGSSRCRSSWA